MDSEVTTVGTTGSAQDDASIGWVEHLVRVYDGHTRGRVALLMSANIRVGQ